jgi:hypothetical protein
VKLVEELGIHALTSKQRERLCCVAEEAARKYVVSKIPSKKIENLDISTEAEGTRPVTLKVDVSVTLSPSIKNFDVNRLVDKAVKEALASADEYMRKLSCHSQK